MPEPVRLASTANSEEFPGFFELQESIVSRLTRQDDQADMSVSVSDAAKLLGITERTVWRRIRQKKLQSRQDHGRTLVRIRHTDMSVAHPDTVTDSPVANTASELLGLIADLSSKLEGATYRNGFLEAQLEVAKESMKLLPDLQARAAAAEQLQTEIAKLRAELEMQKRTWWQRFCDWCNPSSR